MRVLVLPWSVPPVETWEPRGQGHAGAFSAGALRPAPRGCNPPSLLTGEVGELHAQRRGAGEGGGAPHPSFRFLVRARKRQTCAILSLFNDDDTLPHRKITEEVLGEIGKRKEEGSHFNRKQRVAAERTGSSLNSGVPPEWS